VSSLVVLSAADLEWAEEVAQERLRRSRMRGGRDRLGIDELDSHRQGARGELAFCRWLGVPWTASVDTFKGEPDVPPDFEVKAVEKHAPGRPYYLKVPLLDANNARIIARRYVLVVLEAAKAWIIGWLPGRDALERDANGRLIYKRDPKRYSGHPALFVPDGHLLLWTKGFAARAKAEALG
jgi:hypothetical protein